MQSCQDINEPKKQPHLLSQFPHFPEQGAVSAMEKIKTSDGIYLVHLLYFCHSPILTAGGAIRVRTQSEGRNTGCLQQGDTRITHHNIYYLVSSHWIFIIALYTVNISKCNQYSTSYREAEFYLLGRKEASLQSKCHYSGSGRPTPF